MAPRKKSVLFWTALGVGAFCPLLVITGLVLHFVDVDPFVGLRRAVFGPSIEVLDRPTQEGFVNRSLMVDRICHGLQFRDEPAEAPNRVRWDRLPTTYYHRKGPIGLVFSSLEGRFDDDRSWQAADVRPAAFIIGSVAAAGPNAPLAALCSAWSEPPVGVVMMNAGTVAAYARPFQTMDFYESNPRLVELSVGADPGKRKFIYIDDAEKRGARIRVIAGNECKTFEAEAPRRFYHLLIVDISRGDDVSTELMTKEAMKRFLDASVETGIVCIHASHRYCHLWKPIVSAAESLGFAHVDYHDAATKDHLWNQKIGYYSSDWVLVARKAEYFGRIDVSRTPIIADDIQLRMGQGGLRIRRLQAAPEFVWTEDGIRSLNQIRLQRQ
jgi:hypothetical protein